MEAMRRTARKAVQSRTGEVAQRRHRPDYQIILFIGLLMLIGLIIMYAIGPQRANVLNTTHGTDFYSDTYFVLKQTVSLVVAIGAFVAMSIVPFSFIKKYAEKILWAGFALCALLFVSGNLMNTAIAKCSLGACRWFDLGPLGSFQPSEVLKFGLLVYAATFLGIRIRQGLLNDMGRTVIPLGITLLAALFFIVVLQKDMGTGIALTSIVASILVASGMSGQILLKLFIGLVVLGVMMILVAPHRMERVTTFFQGDKALESAEVADTNYHIKNAMIALGTGGLVGLGIGNSIQATGYLPEAINDSVFAIIGETFGFIGVVVILGLFTALLMRLLKIADHLIDMPMRLVVAGVWGWLGAHVVLNVASMIGVFPLTGITLPLLSFGGTSMIFIAAALGLAFQLSRYTSHGSVIKEEAVGHENSLRRRGIGGSRHSGRRRYQ